MSSKLAIAAGNMNGGGVGNVITPDNSGFQTPTATLATNSTFSLTVNHIPSFIVIAVTTFAAEAVNSITGANIDDPQILVPNTTGASFFDNFFMGMYMVTATGTFTATAALAGTPSSSIHIAARAFRLVNGGISAAPDGVPGISGGASGSSFALPTLDPSGPGDLYIALLRSDNVNGFSGATPGYTYDTNNILGLVSNSACNSAPQSPIVTQATSSTTWEIGAALVKGIA
jgi:hypothetical protein